MSIERYAASAVNCERDKLSVHTCTLVHAPLCRNPCSDMRLMRKIKIM